MVYCVNILAHNEEKIIDGCLQSVLKQYLEPSDKLLVTVISNGSTDSTEDIVRDFSCKDSRVSLFSIKDNGKVNALRAFLASKYYALLQENNEIVFFMDADVKLNDPYTIKHLSEKLLSDEILYAVSASCIPESRYNRKRDFVSCLFRVQAKLHQKYKPNILRGMLYCIRTNILSKLKFPKNLLADDIMLEICLDGHFTTDYESSVTYTLHKGIHREIRRNFMHCLGVLQAYRFLKENKICRIDRETTKVCYRARYFSKSDIFELITSRLDVNSLFFLLIYNIYYTINGVKARNILNKYGTEGMDYRRYWKTRK